MSNAIKGKSRRASPELVAILSLGVTTLLVVLGQAAWLGNKIERMGAHLGTKIEAMDIRPSPQIESPHAGQNEIRERVETREALPTLAGTPVEDNEQPPDSAR